MSCPCEPASFKPNVRIGARYGKASKHSGHSCPHPERLELPKMIHRQRLQRQFPDQSMGVLLKIEGNCSCLKAKVAHMVGHLPAVIKCKVAGKLAEGSDKSAQIVGNQAESSDKAETMELIP